MQRHVLLGGWTDRLGCGLCTTSGIWERGEVGLRMPATEWWQVCLQPGRTSACMCRPVSDLETASGPLWVTGKVVLAPILRTQEGQQPGPSLAV